MRRPSSVLILAVAFLVALSATFVFALRAGRHARRLRWESEPIRAWMSVPFIAHTHHLPSEVLFRALGEEPRHHDRRPLRTIAREEHKPVAEIIKELEQALAANGHVHPAPESTPASPPAGKAR